MRANFIHIEEQVRQVLDGQVAGDLAEFGVWLATTFMPMVELARLHGRAAHAVDSFRGMAAPTARDAGRYPAGSLDVGGAAMMRNLASQYKGTVEVHEGWIPEVLGELEGVRFAFVHVDLDQYAPTLAALRFVWPRLSYRGVMMCHDYVEGQQTLASAAIAEWREGTGARCELQGWSQHIIVQKR